jgi:hypothetical protein
MREMSARYYSAFSLSILSCASFATLGCRAYTKEYASGWAWKVSDSGVTALDYPEEKYPSLMKKDDFGICFSGGGNRSAVATLGELRALHASGILERARYISSVSGGTWGAAPWVFLQDSSEDASTLFLGNYVPPEKLTKEQLVEKACDGSFANTASSSGTSLLRAIRRLGGDENFALELGEIYLHPHKLNERELIPVYGKAVMNDMIGSNPGLLSEKNFLVCDENRPYFIAGSAVSRRDHPVYCPEHLYTPFEFTTSYSGARPYTSQRPIFGFREIPIGGGYVDNVIYDGAPRRSAPEIDGRSKVTVRKTGSFSYRGASSRLSLADIMAASGAAPTGGIPGLADIFGFPEFIHASPCNLDLVKPPELLHTDGGTVENLGIMPLLARGVKNILIFSNAASPYQNGIPDQEVDGEPKQVDSTVDCKSPGSKLPGSKLPIVKEGVLPSDIAYLFGKIPARPSWGSRFYHEQRARMNHVLDDEGGKQSTAMIKGFDKAFTNGTTLIHYGTYRVLDQPFYGVKGGWCVNICWVVLASKEKVNDTDSDIMTLEGTEWFKKLPCGDDQSARQALKKEEKGHLENFPYYKTFGNNGMNSRNVISLNALQVNTLAHYTAYSVMKNSDGIKNHLRIKTRRSPSPSDCTTAASPPAAVSR